MSDEAIRVRIGNPGRARLVLGDEPTLRLKAMGGGGVPDYEGSYSVTPTESEQTLATEGKRMRQDVEVGAIAPDYVGSAIERRDSDDLSAISSTIDVPAGYYPNGAHKSVDMGSPGVPTAHKGDVSNHFIAVTPSVTNVGGWISGGTIDGAYVEVSASELVSGDYAVNASGTHDVTVYETATVPSTTVSTTSSEGFHEVPGGGFEWRYRPNAVVGTSGWASAGTVNGQWRNFNAIRKDTHMTPSESTQTIGGGGYMLQDKIYVDPIPSQYIVPSGDYAVDASGSHDVAAYATASVPSTTPTTGAADEYVTQSGARKWRYKPIAYIMSAGWANQNTGGMSGFWHTFDAIPTGTTVTPSTSAQTIGGANTMMEGAVTIEPIPSNYGLVEWDGSVLSVS